MGTPQVLIRKYSDRRLYDTGASRYVKLDDIARMVRDGVDVRVVDGRTGKDLTHLIFTQIIVENAREREIALPLQLLTQLVRASDKATHDFLTWYLNNTLDLYEKAQETVHTRLSSAKNVVASPLEFVRDLLAGHSLQAQAPGPEARELAELRRQVEELQSRLQTEKKHPRSAPKRKPRTRNSD
jgi:polyhydroxyalkanoate synthesis repressor PhaR